MTPPPGERGAALLTVLLLVAVLSVIAADTLDRLSLATRLTGTAVATDQARAFADAAERLAAIRIGALATSERTVDTGWQSVPLPLPLPVGQATLTVTDGGNCFNLNSLVTAQAGQAGQDPSVEPVRQTAVQRAARLARLLGLLRVPPADAQRVADGAADWIDTDDQPGPAGAEDAAYRSQVPQYLPANRLMASPTELRAVAGVTSAVWAAARPWVCALPTTDQPLNPNTLRPEQAPLIAMLDPVRLPVGRVSAALAARPPGGFASVDEFWQAVGVGGQGISDGGLTLRSRWFDARVTVLLDGTERTSRALIDAGDGTAETPPRIVRSWTE